ncbi:hypothetical protein CP8484711_0891B, partial [Chlamydia psittaci 84-8471/1]
RKKQA